MSSRCDLENNSHVISLFMKLWMQTKKRPTKKQRGISVPRKRFSPLSGGNVQFVRHHQTASSTLSPRAVTDRLPVSGSIKATLEESFFQMPMKQKTE
jgi:hypothetical protein